MEVSYQVTIHSQTGKVVFEKSFNSKWKSGISPLFSQKINTDQWSGHYSVKVKVRDKDNQLLTENFIDFEVFNSEDLKVPKAKVAVFDFKGNLKNFLHKSNVKTIDFNRKYSKEYSRTGEYS